MSKSGYTGIYGLKGEFAEGMVCCLADYRLGLWRISAELSHLMCGALS